jgi:hypothetical protein
LHAAVCCPGADLQGHVVDILAFVPGSQRWPVKMEADGIRPVDLDYRDAVGGIFKQIYRDGRFDVMPAEKALLLVELEGPREQRLEQLQAAIIQRGGV